MVLRPENMGSPSPSPRAPGQTGPLAPVLAPPEPMPDFQGLFQHVENIVRKHLAVSNPEKDNQVPNFVKDHLVRACSPETVQALLAKSFSRACLIMKVMVTFVKDFVLQSSLYKGVNPQAESYLAALKDSIFPDTPLRTKYEQQRKIRHEVMIIQHTPNFSALIEPVVRARAEGLYNIIRHLMHGGTTNHMPELIILMRRAYNVASHMAHQVCDWRIDFVPQGIVYRPDFINRDPGCYDHPQKIAEDGVTIRLGFLPQVLRREIVGGTTETTRQISAPHVLLNV